MHLIIAVFADEAAAAVAADEVKESGLSSGDAWASWLWMLGAG